MREKWETYTCVESREKKNGIRKILNGFHDGQIVRVKKLPAGPWIITIEGDIYYENSINRTKN